MLAEYLIGGVLKNELAGFTVNSLRWELMNADDFVLNPLPNHLFQRDNSAWVYDGVSINPMAMPARVRSRCTAPPSTGSTRCSPDRHQDLVRR